MSVDEITLDKNGSIFSSYHGRISHERLKEILDYDPGTGVFKWSRFRIHPGRVAGSKNKNGYLHVKIENGYYLLHRLAWFYVHERWPSMIVSHINGNKTDNRISNLETLTVSQSHMKRVIPNKNTSGYQGVSFHKGYNKWVAYISVKCKKHHLGVFADVNDAIVARKKAEIIHGCVPNTADEKTPPSTPAPHIPRFY